MLVICHEFLWPQVKESVGVPVVANGDIRSEGDVERVKEATGVNGECGCGFGSGKILINTHLT